MPLADPLIVAACYFLIVRLAALPAVAVLQDLDVRATLAGSWRLTAGRYWATLATLLLVGLLMLAGLAIAALVAGLLTRVVPLLSEILALGLSLVVVATFIAPLGVATGLVIWHYLRLRKAAAP